MTTLISLNSCVFCHNLYLNLQMEMECALLEGEYKSETGVIKAEEESLRALQEKLLNIEKEIEKCTAQQAESKRKLEEEQKSLNE